MAFAVVAGDKPDFVVRDKPRKQKKSPAGRQGDFSILKTGLLRAASFDAGQITALV